MTADLLKPKNCACFNIRRAARKITQSYDKALKPAGLYATQFTLLAVLAGNDEGDGIPMAVLAQKMGMDRTTLTRNLGSAERAKWVVVRHGDDRRERLVALTASGRRKLKKAEPYWKAAQKQVLAQLGDGGLGRLLNLTQQLDEI